MKKRINIFAQVIAAAALLLSACGGAPRVDWELAVTGDVAEQTTFTYAELADMPQTELENILMEKSEGEDETGSWSGVGLDLLLDETGAPEVFATITALAADGYAIEITKDELQNAIVALKQDGEWIQEADPDRGPIRLVCPETPANRWVFQLEELQINQ